MDGNLQRMLQLGIVTAVQHDGRKVRVLFPDTGMTSDWLRVIRNVPSVSVSDNEDHNHTVQAYSWMPNINDTVLVIYFPVYNGDGIVLGGI